jgi:hypothetical protein
LRSDTGCRPPSRRSPVMLPPIHDLSNQANRPRTRSPDHNRYGQIPIEPAAPTALNFPRFRALALLRRRPSLAARPSWPASEKAVQYLP